MSITKSKILMSKIVIFAIYSLNNPSPEMLKKFFFYENLMFIIGHKVFIRFLNKLHCNGFIEAATLWEKEEIALQYVH